MTTHSDSILCLPIPGSKTTGCILREKNVIFSLVRLARQKIFVDTDDLFPYFQPTHARRSELPTTWETVTHSSFSTERVSFSKVLCEEHMVSVLFSQSGPSKVIQPMYAKLRLERKELVKPSWHPY